MIVALLKKKIKRKLSLNFPYLAWCKIDLFSTKILRKPTLSHTKLNKENNLSHAKLNKEGQKYFFNLFYNRY